MNAIVPLGADKISAEDSGWPESGEAAPALVLLHEGVGDSRMWNPIWPELTAAFRTIRHASAGTAGRRQRTSGTRCSPT